MSVTRLTFVRNKGFWRADRDSVMFHGDHEGEEFTFLVTSEALALADGHDGHAGAQTAMALFETHHGLIIGIAHHMWVKNHMKQADYLITEAHVEARTS